MKLLTKRYRLHFRKGIRKELKPMKEVKQMKLLNRQMRQILND